MPNSLVQVAFHDAQVVCVMHDGKPFVALRPLCDALEIKWQGQHKAIKADPVLASTVNELLTTGADGKQYRMLCLPLDYLNGWLFKIDAGRYKPGDPRRDRIVAYQRECYQVLHDYFMGTRAPAPAATREEELKLRRDAIDLRRWLVNRGYFDKDAAACLLDMVFAADAPVTIDPTKQYTDAENPYNPVPVAPPMLAAVAMVVVYRWRISQSVNDLLKKFVRAQ